MLHLGNLLLAPLATYVAYRAMRRMAGPIRRRVTGGNVIVMLAFVIPIVAVLASLASS